MTPAQKNEAIDILKEKFSQYDNFYITNTESLSVAQVNKLRRTCFEKGVEMKVAKNTLIRKALEAINSEKYAGVYESLAGVTALMFTNNPKDPAVILSDFRTGTRGEIPGLKAAFIGTDVFVGDNQLAVLKNIKTKNELIGEVIGLLMSPISRVLSALQQKAEKESAGAAESETSEPTASEPTASEPTASEPTASEPTASESATPE